MAGSADRRHSAPRVVRRPLRTPRPSTEWWEPGHEARGRKGPVGLSWEGCGFLALGGLGPRVWVASLQSLRAGRDKMGRLSVRRVLPAAKNCCRIFSKYEFFHTKTDRRNS